MSIGTVGILYLVPSEAPGLYHGTAVLSTTLLLKRRSLEIRGLGLARTNWRCGVGMAEEDSCSPQKSHKTTD